VSHTSPLQKREGCHQAFTLAELLIALAILGVIAMFTIPKILQAQQNSAWKSMAKEAAAMAAGSIKAYQMDNTLDGLTRTRDLTTYLNYVSINTVGLQIDHAPGYSDIPCDTNNRCLILHNGGVLLYNQGNRFANTTACPANNFVYFLFDPDGEYSNSTTGPGKSVWFMVFCNGRVTTMAEKLPGQETCNNSGVCNDWASSPDPDWFSW